MTVSLNTFLRKNRGVRVGKAFLSSEEKSYLSDLRGWWANEGYWWTEVLDGVDHVGTRRPIRGVGRKITVFEE